MTIPERPPLLREGLSLEWQGVPESAEIREQLGGRVDRGDRVGVPIAQDGAAAGELALRKVYFDTNKRTETVGLGWGRSVPPP